MTTRRHCLAGLAVLAAMSGAWASNTYGEVLERGPKPKLIRGKPDKVDFGHGLLVPMSAAAFHTLWEGDDRWITYGHGFGSGEGPAMGQAERAAKGMMKLYLITLAFAPDRLERVPGGGWVLKSGRVEDLVKGDLDLPGRPVMPAVDSMYSYMQTETAGGASGEDGRGGNGAHATTGWLIWKDTVDLDYVRKNAQLL